MNFIKQYPQVIDHEFCSRILEAFDEELSALSAPLKHSTEAYSLKRESERWKDICGPIIELANKKIEDYLSPVTSLIPHKHVLRSVSMLRYGPGQGVPLHYDEEVSPDGTGKNFLCLIYLKSVLLGGELIFPLQHEIIRPEPGLMVIFPTFFTHPHKVIPTVDEERFCLRIEYQIKERVWYTESHY